MLVNFRQCYIEGGVNFPFSHFFQNRISEEITALVEPSAKFIKKYGEDFDLTFNVSAKAALQDNEVRGPTVYRKTKDVEFTVFLPFTEIMRHADAPKHALMYLLKGVFHVFDLLEIDSSQLLATQESLIEGICSDPTMLEAPSWNKVDNESPVRKQFTTFFEKFR